MTPSTATLRAALAPRILSTCTSDACRTLLAAAGCTTPEAGSLLIAAALQIVLQTGTICFVTGYPLSPPGAPTRWLSAVLRLGPDAYADAAGISTARQIRTRWLRRTPMHITCAIAPAPPPEAWATLPDVVYDPALVRPIAALFP